MKKHLLIILLCSGVLIGMTGCRNKKERTMEKLNNVNNKIIEYFSSDNIEYDNFSFNYINTENKFVVVGLLNNSKEKQEQFKEMVIDSDLIKFIQGSENINIPKSK